MKVDNKLWVFVACLLVLFLLIPDHSAIAAQRYLVASGNFNDTAVWSTTSGGVRRCFCTRKWGLGNTGCQQ